MKKIIKLPFTYCMALLVYCALFLNTSTLKAQTCNPYYTSLVGTGTANKTVNFNSTNYDSTVQHFWTFGDGSTGITRNPTKTYVNYGTYMVCHRVTKPGVCNDTFCTVLYLTPSSPCTANFNYFKDTINSTVYFNNTSTGTNLLYTWTFGDSTGSTLQNPSHAYANPGTYTVCLTIRGAFDSTCYSTKCSTIVVTNGNNQPCIANFTYSRDSLNNVHFINSSSGSNLAYYWTFGNNSTSTAMNPTKTFTPGTYTVCLTVQNLLDSNCYHTKCSTITIPAANIPCVAKFTYYRDTINNVFYFNNTSTGNNLGYYWNFGDGTTSTTMNPNKTFTLPGTYNVCLTVRNLLDSTCTNTKCSTIVISAGNTPCHANFTYSLNPQKVNFNDYPCLFNATSSTGNNLLYYWNFGDGWTATSANYLHLFKPGTYNVCLTVRNAFDSTCIDTKCTTITVTGDSSQPCHADFVFWQSNASAHFNNTSTGNNINFSWNFGDGTTSTSQHPIHYYTYAGNFTVCLTISSTTDSCYDTKCKIIYVDSGLFKCNAAFNYHLDSSRVGVFQTLNPQPSGTNYFWDFGDGSSSNSQNPAHQYATNGWYQVCLTVWNNIDSCHQTVCDSIHINNVGTGVKTVEGMSISNMYPIPANNELNIDLLSVFNQPVEVSITDMAGKVFLTKTFTTHVGQNNIKLDISDLFGGMYMVQISNEQGRISKKMIK
ncbi:MAG: PKD domain-containing protein [Bacteroidota bacterium]